MRLHHLQVTAFGPFAGTEAVDFDALGADGLFLLHGPTGAGKTTVLDAVAFALFGELPGARRDPDGRRLRSDHAAAGVTPRVQLELTVGGRRMRLVRTPEHQRAKKRGAGTTKQNATASLTWLDVPAPGAPAGEGVTRIDEVAREVQQLLGMNAAQFFQVVLLPQGEFAKFLRSSTDARATLLEQLFRTGRFGAAEQWLVERRRRAAAAAESGVQQVGVLLGQLCTAAEHDGELPAPGTSLGWAQGLASSAHHELERVATGLAAAQQGATSAASMLTRAREPLQHLARRDRARQQLADLAASEPHRTVLAAAVASAHRAGPVLAAAEDATQCETVAARATAAAREPAVQLESDADGAAALADHALAERCDAWRTEVGRLAELVELGDALAGHERRVRELRAVEQRRGVEQAELEQRCLGLPALRVAADATLLAARHAAGVVPALAAALERAKEVASAAAQVPPLRRAHEAALALRSVALVEHQRVREDWLDLREVRLDGMAAELAGNLRAGQACGVCGATEHPRPAQVGGQVVSDADERHAHAVEQAAGVAVQEAVGRVAAALRELDAAGTHSAGLDPDAADEALGAAERACTQASVLAAAVPSAEQRCTTLAAEAEEVTGALRIGSELLAAAQTERHGLEGRIGEARERLDGARSTDADVPVRRARLDALATAAARLLAAQTEADGARRTATQRAERAEALAAEAGFDGVGAARSARIGDSELALIDAELDAARDQRSAASAVLAEAEVAALGALDEPAAQACLEQAQEGAAASEQELARAQGAHATARQRATTLDRLLARLVERLDVLGPLLAEAERVGALADVVAGRGQNSRKVSLHSYVLAARLEQVAVAASQRLRRMSGGRYEFVHSDAAGPHGTRGGLGLDVLDDHTGAVRSTKTLSGGESFLASLSLALGLADVVAEEAGGVQLDTLFIDEGFGTLDPGALEEVMAVLDELRAGGRVVGLVSHVDELRQRIPNRLHVMTSRTGSHLAASTG